jgi:uncharacterized protein YndB with AHSA1/START domain
MNRTPRRIRRIAAALAVAATAAAVLAACATTPPADSAPVAAPRPTPAAAPSCDGATIDHSAAITSAHDIVIDAPIAKVWATHTDVERWSEWQGAVTSIHRLQDGPLEPGASFRWTTPVPESGLSPADTLTITSTVQHVEPGHCILWQGPAIGSVVSIDRGVHLWTFTADGDTTRVHTEESWDSPVLAGLTGDDAVAAEQMLGGGLQLWLEDLKQRVESQR